MWVTIYDRGTVTRHAFDRFVNLGGDPRVRTSVARADRGTWSCQIRADDAGGWGFELRANSQPETALNGRPVVPGPLYPVVIGDVIQVDKIAIAIGYLASALPAAEPLTPTERAMLATVAADAGDEPRRVLGDLWQEGDDEPRGTLIHAQCEGAAIADELALVHGARWCEPAIAAGFAQDGLVFERGFVPPLVLEHDEPFARSPHAFRLSVVAYHLTSVIEADARFVLHEATRMTAAGPAGTVTIKIPYPHDEGAAYFVDRERQILERFDSPHLPRVVDHALARPAQRALVLDGKGRGLDEILRAARAADRVPGEAVAISIGIQLCRGLEVVHAGDVVHADLRPGVIAIRDGTVVIHDFGEARCDLPLAEERNFKGTYRGRFKYLSPERARGEYLDAASDVFAVAMMIALLVGLRHPIMVADGDLATLQAIIALEFTIPSTRSALGPHLATLLVREREPRASAARLERELVAIAAAANLRVGPDVIAAYVTSLDL